MSKPRARMPSRKVIASISVPADEFHQTAGAYAERARTVAILDSFLAAPIPPHDHTLVKVIRDRIMGRAVSDVIRDEEPVIHHPSQNPGPKRSRRS